MKINEYEEIYRSIEKSFIKTPLLDVSKKNYFGKKKVFFKLENLQIGGSFKIRGVANKFEIDRPTGETNKIAAVSGGNFGIALAIAAKENDLELKILVPASAPKNSVEKMRSYGASVDIIETVKEAFEKIKELEKIGYQIIDDCDDQPISLGYTTIAYEMYKSNPDLTEVFVSVGGGSLISGISSFYRNICPQVRIWGVEPIGANSMKKSLENGQPTEVEINSKISTLGVPKVAKTFFDHVREEQREIIEVEDEEAFQESINLMNDFKIVAEPASGCALAGLKKVLNRLPDESAIGVLICGGNINPDDLFSRHH